MESNPNIIRGIGRCQTCIVHEPSQPRKALIGNIKRLEIQKLLTPNIVLLAGPLYFIWTLTVLVTATMDETSTARTSPISRFFCTTNNKQNPMEHPSEKLQRRMVEKNRKYSKAIS